MIKKCLLSAVAALLAAPVLGQKITGPAMSGAPAAAGIFAAVSVEEANSLKAMLPTSGAIPLVVPTLLNVDVTVPEQRALLAPLKFAQASGKTEIADILALASQAVLTQRKTTINEATSTDASLAQLEAALADFGRLRRLVSLYEPEAGLLLESEYLKAEQRTAAMRAAAVKASAERTATALNQPKKDESVDAPATADGRVAVAQALIKELRDSADTEYSEGLVDKLQAMALEAPAYGSLYETIARAFVAEIQATADTDYGEYIIDRLQTLALQAASPTDRTLIVRTLIVDGLMKDAHKSADSDYIDYVLDAVESIAIAAPENDVKGLAIAHMLKEIKDTADTDYSDETQGRIDKIAESAGGLANISVPDLPKPTPPAPRQPKAEVSFEKQLSEGASSHPFGAFFGLVALAGTVYSMAIHSFPVLGIILAGGLLLAVGTRALYTDHPVAGFFQLLVIGDLFASTATFGAGLSAGSWLALAVGGLVGASVADWSFKKDRPVLGFFLNLILMWMFLALTIGPQAAGALLSITTS